MKTMKKRWILDEREIRQKKMGVCRTGEQTYKEKLMGICRTGDLI